MRIDTGCRIWVPLDGKVIGSGKPIYIIAEVGVTANGDLDTALKLIDAAKECGADAVKFQMIDPEFMADKTVEYTYECAGGKKTVNMYEMFKSLAFTNDEWKQIANHCSKVGITFFTSVDALWHVDFCEELGVPAYKIGAWDMRFYPLIRKVAQTGKSVFVDLGPALLGEIVQMFNELTLNGCRQVILMHENHGEPEEFNLNTIPYLQRVFNVPVGWSPSGVHWYIDVLTKPLGVNVIERKLTLDCKQEVHGHVDALEPIEFTNYVKVIHRAEEALGQYAVRPSLEDLRMKDLYFTSIVYDADLPAGTVLEDKHFACRRPGVGISPMYIDRFVGKTLVKDVKRNDLVGWYDV